LFLFYLGCNSHFVENRTLIRKDGRAVPVSAMESSLPPWIGPQYYEADYDPSNRADTTFQVSFRALPRNAVSSEVVKRSKILGRKKELHELSKSLSSTSHLEANQSIGSKLSSDKSWKKLFNDDDWNFLEKKRKDALLSGEDDCLVSNDDADQALYGEGALEDDELEENSNDKVGKSKTTVDFRFRSYTEDDLESAIRAVQEDNFSASTFYTEIVHNDDNVNQQRTDNSIDMTNSCGNSRTNQNSSQLNMAILPPLEAPQRNSTAQLSKCSPAKRLFHFHDNYESIQRNKLASQQEYQLKILQAEENFYQKHWKPKDYTMNALENQLPLQLDTYPLTEEFFAKPNSWTDDKRVSPGHKKTIRSFNNGSSLTSSASVLSADTIAIGATNMRDPHEREFSNPLLFAKPAVFKTSGEILAMRNTRKDSTKLFTQGESEGLNGRIANDSFWKPEHSISESISTAVGVHSSNNNNLIGGNSVATTEANDRGSHDDDLMNYSSMLSSTSSLPNNRPVSAAIPLDVVPDATVGGSVCSGPVKHPLVDSPTFYDRAKTLKTLLRPHESTAKTLNTWYKEEGIKKATYQRESDGEKWLKDHPVLPSIALSLHGLLLEENPFNGKTFESAFEYHK